jgi:hypothetical protein
VLPGEVLAGPVWERTLKDNTNRQKAERYRLFGTVVHGGSRPGPRLCGGEGPALVGIARAVAKIQDLASQLLAGAVKGSLGEALLDGGPDDVTGLDGLASGGEVLEEPLGAEVELGGRGRWVYPL